MEFANWTICRNSINQGVKCLKEVKFPRVKSIFNVKFPSIKFNFPHSIFQFPYH